jgi:phosphate acyltransferase
MTKRIKKIKIAVDLMGSELSPLELLKGCLASERSPQVSYLFIGTKDLEKSAKQLGVEFKKAKEVILMDENPLAAIRSKKNSSISVGMELLKKGMADALVSAGNTGALMTLAKMKLSMLPHISRPSLLALLPTQKKTLTVIDVGANISPKSKYLIQNGLLGVSFQKAMGNKNPTLALLNIGSEAQKGTKELKKTFDELKKISSKTALFYFAGNIESTEVFQSEIDVLVTDGFTGNIFLKTAEGIVNFVLDRLMECGKKCENVNPYFSDLKKYLHHDQYPGALLCGIDKIVIKCHSSSSIQSFINAIKGSHLFIKKNIAHSLSSHLMNLYRT